MKILFWQWRYFAFFENVQRGFIRGSLGSLTDARVEGPDGRERVLLGPAIEVVGLGGEVQMDAGGVPCATLNGMVVDPTGRVTGGGFVRGQNPVCVTFEISIEEWIPERTESGAAKVKSDG